MGKRVKNGVDRAGTTGAGTTGDGRPSRSFGGWKGVMKSLLALGVARSTQRVLGQQKEQAEAGRLGGEVGAVAARPAPRAAAVAARDKERPKKQADAAAPAAPKGVVEIAKKVFSEFGKDNGSLMAAAVAFYLVLSLVPLLLLGVSVLGFVLRGNGEAINETLKFLNQLVPAVKDAQVKHAIEGVINARGKIGLTGLAGVALTATGGFATLENAINAMWNRPNRSFLMNKVYAFGMMLAVGLLFLFSFGITALVSWAGRLPLLHWLASNGLFQVVGYVLPILITSLMFSLIYRFYPNGRSGWRSSLTAGVVTAILWEAFKIGYTFYTQRGDTSPYGVAIGLVMWIFYSSTLVLMGSELTWVLEGCPGQESKDLAQAQRGR